MKGSDIMSRFNQAVSIEEKRSTVNKQGYQAYVYDSKMDLVTRVLNTFLSPNGKFHNKNEQVELEQAIDTMCVTNPMFVAQLGVYARKEMNLRSVSHIIAARLAKNVKGEEFTKLAITSMMQRPDDLTECLAYYLGKFGKPVPNCLKKGLGRSITFFNDYQLAKYDRGHSAEQISLQDVANLCRPKSYTDKQELYMKQLMTGTLPIPYTWETELSARGNTQQVWKELIDSGKVGYMALLRNLNNILNADCSRPHIQKVATLLSNSDAVARNKQLPFRYFSAYRMVSQNSNRNRLLLMDALEEAILLSIKNIETIPGHSLIAIDVSSSMGSKVSEKSTVTCNEIAAILGIIAHQICEQATIVTFDTRLENYQPNKKTGIIGNINDLFFSGGGTNVALPFQFACDNYHMNFDRIITLSDNENNVLITGNYGWNRNTGAQQLMKQYFHHNPKGFVHAIDLQGYGTTQVCDNRRVNYIAGWSEQILTFINLFEQDKQTIINKIEQIKV